MSAGRFVCVVAVLALAAPLWGDDDYLDPNCRNGTVTIGGTEFDFWKEGGLPPAAGSGDLPLGDPGSASATIPEPATLLLLGLGGLGVLLKRRPRLR